MGYCNYGRKIYFISCSYIKMQMSQGSQRNFQGLGFRRTFLLGFRVEDLQNRGSFGLVFREL